MGLTAFDGPLGIWGDLGKIPSSIGGANGIVNDPNADAGPSYLYQGIAFPDPRLLYPKDQAQGYPGSVRMFSVGAAIVHADCVPAALGAANIAAAQNVTSGTAMTLASASAGVVVAIPFQTLTSTIVTSGLTLDFGFAYGNVTANSTTITVADSTVFTAGMPIIIAGVGNAAGTTPLLTFVTSLASATTITVEDTPLATNATAAIGMGNTFPAGEYVGMTAASNTPTGHLPYLPAGIGLLFDPSQGLSRGVRCVGTAGGCSGGTFLVSGYDVYGVSMSELITVTAGASTGWSTKCFKHIASVTPQFTDANDYTVGTSDVFGAAIYSPIFERENIVWGGSAATQGWTAGDTTTATTTTGDVRGTFQVGANGAGSDGAPGGPSNGAVSGLVMSGRRLYWTTRPSIWNSTRANVNSQTKMFGVTQA